MSKRGSGLLRVDALKIDPLPPLSFSVAKGECLAIEGPSGSGKTRLLRAIADLDRVRGHVYLDGAERNEMSGHAWRKLVRFASAEFAWWSDTARPAFPGEGTGASDKLARLLAALALEARVMDRPLNTLARGERQRLAFARALIDDPSVLLFDQPAMGLDPQLAALIEETIRYQILAGRIVLIAGNDRNQFDRLAHARLQLARPLPQRGATAS